MGKLKGAAAMRTMRVAGRAIAVSAVLAMAGLVTNPASSTAKVLYRESFEGGAAGIGAQSGGEPVGAPHGSAWRGLKGGSDPAAFNGVAIDLRKEGIGALPKGTISVWLQRSEADKWETVLSFYSADHELLSYVQFIWGGWPQERRDLLQVESVKYPLWYDEYVEKGMGKGAVRANHDFPIPKIGRGAWFNLALTWGPSAADRGIYVAGERLKVKTKNGFAMNQLLAASKYLVVGSQPGKWGANGWEGSWSILRSPVDAIVIHDVVKAEFPQVYPGSDAARISSVFQNVFKTAGFSGKLVAGDKFRIAVEGTAGATASYDLARLADMDRKIALDWSGFGVYLEEKRNLEEGEVNLRDVNEYRVFAAKEPLGEITAEREPLARVDVKEQKYTLEWLDRDTPYYVAVVAAMRDGSLRTVIASREMLPMEEKEPGSYAGHYQVTFDDRYDNAVVVGRISKGTTAAILADDKPFVIDPSLSVAVETEPKVLKADEKSVSKVTVTVTDANGNAVAGHKVRFLLATTSQYTGVVGGGAFADQVGGKMAESTWGETDLFGRLTTTYVAGFAAKTAIIVARDMMSNSTGAGYVTTYIQAAAELELEPVQQLAAAAAGYEITVTSSDDWLTADGKSQARITARVTLGGAPVEGHEVNFSVSAGTGSIRTVSGTTDRRGEARAVYTAGKKIGIVLITATDSTVGISGTCKIELRSDAPAKIKIEIKPEKLPADGRSTADLLVLVTDINDNPNDNVEVEYRVPSGNGSLKDATGMTDRNGESENEYTAGETPGRVQIEITVRSTTPTAEEIEKARSLALAVTDYDFF